MISSRESNGLQTPSTVSSSRRLKANVNTNQPSSRVKVAVRCRPAFQDEIDFAQGNFMSIVDTRPERPEQSLLGQISLTLMSGKQRDFLFDYVCL